MLNIHSQKYVFVRSCVAMVALTVFMALYFIHMLMSEAEKLGYFLYLIFKKLFFKKPLLFTFQIILFLLIRDGWY